MTPSRPARRRGPSSAEGGRDVGQPRVLVGQHVLSNRHVEPVVDEDVAGEEARCRVEHARGVVPVVAAVAAAPGQHDGGAAALLESASSTARHGEPLRRVGDRVEGTAQPPRHRRQAQRRASSTMSTATARRPPSRRPPCPDHVRGRRRCPAGGRAPPAPRNRCESRRIGQRRHRLGRRVERVREAGDRGQHGERRRRPAPAAPARRLVARGRRVEAVRGLRHSPTSAIAVSEARAGRRATRVRSPGPPTTSRSHRATATLAHQTGRRLGARGERLELGARRLDPVRRSPATAPATAGSPAQPGRASPAPGGPATAPPRRRTPSARRPGPRPATTEP